MTGPFPAWTILLAFAHLATGVVLGFAYFHNLWRNARLLAAGAPTRTAAWMAGRLILLACVLALTSLEGATALLATGLGVLAGRAIVRRRVWAAVP
jgi:hypothetical protein